MPPKRILISGAGISGLTFAHWMKRLDPGAEITAIDHARRFEAKGHIIALKGTGVRIVEMMGLREILAPCAVPAKRTRYATAADRTIRLRETSDMDSSLGGYLMLRRADLHAALYDLASPHIDLRFNTSLKAVEQRGDGVAVEYSTGAVDVFDLVVGSDGVHSQTRKLAFPELREVPFGGNFVAMLPHGRHGLDTSTITFVVSGGRSAAIIPLDEENCCVGLYMDDQCPVPPMGDDSTAWRDYLGRVYADYPAAFHQVFALLGESDFIYADQIAMIPARQAVQGHVALLGDAGYCPTFFSGMGAALGMQAGFCLAHQLAKEPDIVPALAAYEAKILPLATSYQANALSLRRRFFLRSPVKQAMRDFLFGVIPDSVFEKQQRRFYRAELDVGALA